MKIRRGNDYLYIELFDSRIDDRGHGKLLSKLPFIRTHISDAGICFAFNKAIGYEHYWYDTERHSFHLGIVQFDWSGWPWKDC